MVSRYRTRSSYGLRPLISNSSQRSPAVRSTFAQKSFRSPHKKQRGSGSRANLLGSGSGKSNIWTPEEREDLYNRRQTGEDWESICRDYPSRSRHAMQQQYSVEKKKHIGKAIDLRTGRRGGRKPRAAHTRGHHWTSINKLPLGSDEELEDSLELADIGLEDEEDTDYEDVDNAAEEDSQAPEEEILPMKSPRPPPLARSVTEPTTRQKAARKAMFPNLPVSAGLPPASTESPTMEPPSNKRKTPMNEVSETESRSSSHQTKRPKYSTEPSETDQVVQRSETTPLAIPKTPLTPFNSPELIFSAQAVAKAREDAREWSTYHETNKMAVQDAHQANLKRYIQRATDAETQRNEALAEYKLKLKFRDTTHAQELSALKDQIGEWKEQLKKACADAQIEREKQEQELSALKAQFDALKTSTETEKQAHTISTTSDDTLRQQLERQEQQLKLYDQLRGYITTEVEKPLRLGMKMKSKGEEANESHNYLTAMISKLNTDFEDLSNKAIIRTLKEIADANEALHGIRQEEQTCFHETWAAVESFVKQFETPREDLIGSDGGATAAVTKGAEGAKAGGDGEVVATTTTETVTVTTVPSINTAVAAVAASAATGSPRRRSAR